MKKILFLIRTLNIGGAEHVLVDVSNYLAAAGYHVTVQTLIDDGEYRERLSAQIRYRPGIRKDSFIQRTLLHFLLMLPDGMIGNILISKGYTHIVAFTEGLPAKVIGGFSRSNVKKIAWVHTDLHRNSASINVFGNEAQNRKCYEQFDHIIWVSNDARRGYIERLGEHRSILVQYNPLNRDEIIRKSLSEVDYLTEKNDRFRIVSVGRLAQVKGFDLLIKAFAIAEANVNKQIELYIVGGGAEMDALKKQISVLHLEDRVFLCGQQGNPYSIMSKCDMQVIPSRAEGYSLALCEGHFLGLPAVATKCSGPVEILSASRGGLLVDISAEALADGIIRMTNDEMLFAACKKNVQKWSESYDANAVYKQIEKLFE